MSSVAPMICWMQTLSDPTRARLLRLLDKSELTVVEMCTTLQLPQSTVSRHLKVLADDGWVTSRRDGSSNLYRIMSAEMDQSQKRLWSVARAHSVPESTAEQDDARLEQVLEARRSKSQTFFSTAANRWDRLRTELFGNRIDAWALSAMLPNDAIVGDLGCGTGLMTQMISPWVKQVIAVDSSTAMLNSARKRLRDSSNVDLRRGELSQLPIDDNTLSLSILLLVLPYLVDPEAVFAEAHRVTRVGGRMVVVDMTPHDRVEYREELGHSWLGFSQDQIRGWMNETHWTMGRFQSLPPEPEAKGTGLFVATGIKE